MSRRAAIALAVTLASAGPGWASAAILSQLPRPATLSACQVWAGKQDEVAVYMWGQQEDGDSSRTVAMSRLTSTCMGGERPEIVGFGSSAGFDRDFCSRHRGTTICALAARGEAPAARVCTVADATPTPLNYRTAPYGKILAACRT